MKLRRFTGRDGYRPLVACILMPLLLGGVIVATGAASGLAFESTNVLVTSDCGFAKRSADGAKFTWVELKLREVRWMTAEGDLRGTRCETQILMFKERPVDASMVHPFDAVIDDRGQGQREQILEYLSQTSSPMALTVSQTFVDFAQTGRFTRRSWARTITGGLQTVPLVVLVEVAVGIALIGRLTMFSPGVIGTRRLRRGECPRCRYPLLQATSTSCSECGVEWGEPAAAAM